MAGPDVLPPAPPRPTLGVGITGHRASHPALAAGAGPLAAAIEKLLVEIDGLARESFQPAAAPETSLYSLLADGADAMAAEAALELGWSVTAPLPVGAALYRAILSDVRSPADAHAILQGRPPADAAAARAVEAHATLCARARLFELAEADRLIEHKLAAHLEDPSAETRRLDYALLLSERTAMAGGVMLAHIDILIAAWDGQTPGGRGGTADIVAQALALGIPVVWIDAGAPERRHLLTAPESVGGPAVDCGTAQLRALVAAALASWRDDLAGRTGERWHAHSPLLFHGYRRIEQLFGDGRALGSLRTAYELPAAIARGTGSGLVEAARGLPDGDPAFAQRISDELLPRFAWFDAVSTRLADLYRGGMTASFVLAALAVIIGLSYQVFGEVRHKWMTAAAELLLLFCVLVLTTTGVRRRWHSRWLQGRRLAEYLRHAPLPLLLGAGRPAGRWPESISSRWPEAYARHVLRGIGLPRARVTTGYLRMTLDALSERHVVPQRDYHRAKALRLSRVHHRLDRLSETFFMAGVATVLLYLLLWAGTLAGTVGFEGLAAAAKTFTFLGVAFPTLGGAVAGIRFFGDFERFASISRVTAERLDAIAERIAMLARLPDAELDHGRVAAIAVAADEAVVAEIESWQAVFAGKIIAVPV